MLIVSHISVTWASEYRIYKVMSVLFPIETQCLAHLSKIAPPNPACDINLPSFCLYLCSQIFGVKTNLRFISNFVTSPVWLWASCPILWPSSSSSVEIIRATLKWVVWKLTWHNGCKWNNECLAWCLAKSKCSITSAVWLYSVPSH